MRSRPAKGAPSRSRRRYPDDGQSPSPSTPRPEPASPQAAGLTVARYGFPPAQIADLAAGAMSPYWRSPPARGPEGRVDPALSLGWSASITPARVEPLRPASDGR